VQQVPLHNPEAVSSTEFLRLADAPFTPVHTPIPCALSSRSSTEASAASTHVHGNDERPSPAADARISETAARNRAALRIGAVARGALVRLRVAKVRMEAAASRPEKKVVAQNVVSARPCRPAYENDSEAPKVSDTVALSLTDLEAASRRFEKLMSRSQAVASRPQGLLGEMNALELERLQRLYSRWLIILAHRDTRRPLQREPQLGEQLLRAAHAARAVRDFAQTFDRAPCLPASSNSACRYIKPKPRQRLAARRREHAKVALFDLKADVRPMAASLRCVDLASSRPISGAHVRWTEVDLQTLKQTRLPRHGTCAADGTFDFLSDKSTKIDAGASVFLVQIESNEGHAVESRLMCTPIKQGVQETVLLVPQADEFCLSCFLPNCQEVRHKQIWTQRRIVLSWQSSCADLSLHLLWESGDVAEHVHARSVFSADGSANFDTAAPTDGCESITVERMRTDAVYACVVCAIGKEPTDPDRTTRNDTRAILRVYDSHGLELQVHLAEDGSHPCGCLWDALRFDGGSGAVHVCNKSHPI
jgi:hypothetical protein